MAQVRSDNILADLPKILDDKMGVAGNNPSWRPYNNVAEFTTRFPVAGRAEGQMFWVRDPDDADKSILYYCRKTNKVPHKFLEDYVTLSEFNLAISEITDQLNATKGATYQITTTNTDTNEFTLVDLIDKDVLQISVAGQPNFAMTNDPLQTLNSEDVFFNIDTGQVNFESAWATGTKITFLYNNNTNDMGFLIKNWPSYASMAAFVPYEREGILYVNYINEDEQNGGGLPATYLRYNGKFVRDVSQQAII